MAAPSKPDEMEERHLAQGELAAEGRRVGSSVPETLRLRSQVHRPCALLPKDATPSAAFLSLHRCQERRLPHSPQPCFRRQVSTWHSATCHPLPLVFCREQQRPCRLARAGLVTEAGPVGPLSWVPIPREVGNGWRVFSAAAPRQESPAASPASPSMPRPLDILQPSTHSGDKPLAWQ